MDLPANTITILTGLIGVLCGTALSSYFSLKSSRKDLMFKRKLEYFEKLSKDLEENYRLHKRIIMSISNSTKKVQIYRILNELKKDRKNLLIAASPLYFDIERISPSINHFVSTEKSIFSSIEKFAKINKNSTKEKVIFELRENLQKLSRAEQFVIFAMKRELYQ